MIGTKARCVRAAVLSLVMICGCGCEQASEPEAVREDKVVEPSRPAPGDSEFVSVDNKRLDAWSGGTTSGVFPSSRVVPGSLTPIELREPLSDQRILSVNHYRGLQVLDLSDPDAPRVEGQLALYGEPVGLHLVGDVAYVLLSRHRTSAAGDSLAMSEVSLITAVDISDRSEPVLLHKTQVEGVIRASQLATHGSENLLHVAVEHSVADGSESTTLLRYRASRAGLETAHQLELGEQLGYRKFTPAYFVATRVDATADSDRPRLLLVDLSTPDVPLELGAEVTVRAPVNTTSQIDVRAGKLRVVSRQDNEEGPGYLEVFDIADLTDIERLDECTFSGSPRATTTAVFTDNAVFIREAADEPKPASVFTIDAMGRCAEQKGHDLPGDTALQPVAADSRLIALRNARVDGQEREHVLEVTLHDITASNVLAQQGASGDERLKRISFHTANASVIERATSATAPDGSLETGLIAVPFEGHRPSGFVQGVQFFSFSNTTLTRRGHTLLGAQRPIAFAPRANRSASLTTTNLSLHDIASDSEDVVTARGQVEVAPDETAVFFFGEYTAKAYIREARFESIDPASNSARDRVDVLKDAEVVSTLEIPSGARLRQVGDLLVSVTPVGTTSWDPRYHDGPVETSIQVFDLSDPTQPELRSTFNSDRLTPTAAGPRLYYVRDDGVTIASDLACLDCTANLGNHVAGIYALGSALVFAEVTEQQQSVGWWQQCTWRARDAGRTQSEETRFTGEHICAGPEGERPACRGEIQACTSDGCEPVDVTLENATEQCFREERLRPWNKYRLQVLDLSDPEQPLLIDPIELPDTDEGVSIVQVQDKLYINTARPLESAAATPLVRRYVRTFSMSGGKPSLSEAINVPGEVLEVDGDTIITRDRVWNDGNAETIAARVALKKASAKLLAMHSFGERPIANLALDGAGHLLVSCSETFDRELGPFPRLALLDAEGLSMQNELGFNAIGTLTRLSPGRVLVSRWFEVAVINTEDAMQPRAEAFLLSTGSERQLAQHDNELIVATGRYGSHRFDLSAQRLQPER